MAAEKTKKVLSRRNRLLAAVHIAKAALGMDDGTYRAVLKTFGAESSAKLDDAKLLSLMRHFERCGYKSRTKKPRAFDGPKKRQLSKIGALLTVGKKPWAYADGIAKKMFRTDKVEWLDGEQLGAVIAALIKQGKREGWDLR